MEKFVRRNFENLRAVGGLPPPPPGFPDLAEQVQFAIDPHQSIDAMSQLLPRVGAVIGRLGYQVLHNATDVELITSDNPTCYYEPADNGDPVVPYP